VSEGPTGAGTVASLWERRRLLAVTTLGAGAAAVVLSLLLPPRYQAVVTIIPAMTPDRMSQFGTMVGPSLEDLAFQASVRSGSSVMYPSIVRSRRLLEQVLAMRFPTGRDLPPRTLIDLIQPRGSGAMRTELAVRALQRRVDATLDRRTGVLTIRVDSPFPPVASGIANALSSLLQDFVVHSLTSQAGENRKFIEGRLQDVALDLAHAEEELRLFRERNLRIGNSPRLLLEEGRLIRGVREHEEIYIALKRQFELTKVQEQRDVPVLNVLDAAAVPVLRSAPKRVATVLVGLLLGFGLGAGLVVTANSARR